MKSDYEKLSEKVKEIALIGSTNSMINWDQLVMMPPKGAQLRAEQSAYLLGLSHKKFTSKAVGKLLEKLNSEIGTGSLTEDQEVNVRELTTDYERSKKLPQKFVEEESMVTSTANGKWEKAREESDFSIFQDSLERIVDLCRRKAELYGYEGHPYNALAYDYEPGITVEKLDRVFGELRPFLIELVGEIENSGMEVKDIKGSYPIDAQKRLGLDAVKLTCFDLKAGRLDESTHPFTGGVGPNDVRLTTRYDENDLLYSLISTIHEAGHGLYEQGLPEGHFGMPLCDAVSMGIHESQSKIWEDHVGKSWDFWRFFLPKVKEEFPLLKGTRLKTWMRSVNKVERSLIRTESDEVTYGLHIILRYEIEKQILEGNVEVKDLPEMWNQKMEEYIGIIPPNDKLGVLQDVHWAWACIGYFPTYSLGTIYAAQLMDRFEIEHQNEAAIGFISGDYSLLRGWLKENVHQYGRRYLPEDLIEKATGSRLDAKPFMDYLDDKYSDLYGF